MTERTGQAGVAAHQHDGGSLADLEAAVETHGMEPLAAITKRAHLARLHRGVHDWPPTLPEEDREWLLAALAERDAELRRVEEDVERIIAWNEQGVAAVERRLFLVQPFEEVDKIARRVLARLAALATAPGGPNAVRIAQERRMASFAVGDEVRLTPRAHRQMEKRAQRPWTGGVGRITAVIHADAYYVDFDLWRMPLAGFEIEHAAPDGREGGTEVSEQDEARPITAEDVDLEITAADIARRNLYRALGPSDVVVLALDIKDAIEKAVTAERRRQEATRAGLVEALCEEMAEWELEATRAVPSDRPFFKGCLRGLRDAIRLVERRFAAPVGTPSAPSEEARRDE